ncbi:multifunctional CCA tRNA nucleotidyl transferase/2'3'-cyclic phosphodiesterase/2'nucleotidase/phosphatase [Marinobacter sp. NP-4(2019)]|uniref:multifunctional CCA tRNA nucleotidyl transferase/2'3'-cyclic phosphodiesterase/2'nucleotidase/phosphatase n=1 Tax=Marinobacter sp. NP-4(2019) TaxID=2488665 RepID=UPI000FC3E6EA|nr:multifunctional CCA tRNA nucleotidyl transferase/2'3'-cyclic phosphodiesterase/2'nucleotidase/phosphatase [Marinobacter sp. NP-4(2019)]AZT85072.1 multifunctional CCA tRNA nucleotidyl transferase/2'3'-cyclic phosphodiesterase/2'nucleotidase/phosphatase [Marinobacter sp. NP-4(2019)]
MEIYLVGGAVRDELLGLEVKDRDWVVVGATPEEMLKQGFKQVGADFPVFLHPATREEYALARTERKDGRGYHGFTVYSAPDVTLEDDLRRRDLTINAMARSTSGELIDPFNGKADIEALRLRHVSEAFAEDPLRILRTARFAARLAPMGFHVADSTMKLMQQMTGSGEVDHLVPERVWQEIQRALHENDPVTFFNVLQACHALAVLIPELSDASVLTPALASLNCASARDTDTATRFAALLSHLPEDQTSQRARALKAPNDCQEMARLASRLAPELREQADAGMTEQGILALLDEADTWRRPERFQRLLTALRCSLPLRYGAAVNLLQESAGVAAAVDARELMTQGHKGKGLGEAIRRERLHRIAELIPKHPH